MKPHANPGRANPHPVAAAVAVRTGRGRARQRAGCVVVAGLGLAGCVGTTARAPAPRMAAPATTPAAMAIDLTPIDVTADPCFNFARFACGTAGSGSSRVVRADDAWAWRRPSIERFMVEIAAGKHDDPEHGTPLLREFYVRCTDVGARAAGISDLRVALDDLASARTLADLARRLGRLRAHGTRLLIDLTPQRSAVDPDGMVTGRLGLAAPKLPRRFYAPAHPLVAAYRQHWQRLAHLSGSVTADEADAAARVDTWLAGLDASTPRDAPHLGPVATDELARARFPWTAYLEGVGPSVPGPFVARGKNALARVDQLATLPLADLRSYARVMLIERWAEFLDEAFLAEELQFHEGLERGRAGGVTLALPAACTALAARDLNPLLADAYLSELPNPGSETLARQLFDRLRTRLDRRVRRADWLDDGEKTQARRRLAEVALVFVDDIEAPRDMSPVLPTGSFLDLYRRTRELDARSKLGLIGRPWTEEPLTPTLSPGEYFNQPNRVWVSPEIVKPPYLRGGAFNAVSFGALGTILGHEIAHAIPAVLRRSAEAPSSSPSLSPSSLPFPAAVPPATPAPVTAASAALSARLACLKGHIDRISAQAPVDSRHTLGESWADRVGVDLALEVMDDEAITAGRSQALAVWQREFFVAYAQTMCRFQDDNPREIDSLRDPHAPTLSRINSVVADSPEFAAAFGCAPDRPMAPQRRCTAW